VGLVGWRGDRAKNLSKTLSGQLHHLMSELFSNASGTNWHHGGTGSGVNTAQEMYELFNSTENVNQATAAITRGYVRPEEHERDKRKRLSQIIKKYMK
jgi:hypothetical protein